MSSIKIAEVANDRPLSALDQFAKAQANLVRDRSVTDWHAIAMSFADLLHRIVNDDEKAAPLSQDDMDKALTLLRRAGR